MMWINLPHVVSKAFVARPRTPNGPDSRNGYPARPTTSVT
jgi:hypothetical protein